MNIFEWIDICMSKGREINLMKESYDFSVSIRTLKKELPETSQVGIGEDASLCLKPNIFLNIRICLSRRLCSGSISQIRLYSTSISKLIWA